MESSTLERKIREIVRGVFEGIEPPEYAPNINIESVAREFDNTIVFRALLDDEDKIAITISLDRTVIDIESCVCERCGTNGAYECSHEFSALWIYSNESDPSEIQELNSQEILTRTVVLKNGREVTTSFSENLNLDPPTN